MIGYQYSPSGAMRAPASPAGYSASSTSQSDEAQTSDRCESSLLIDDHLSASRNNFSHNLHSKSNYISNDRQNSSLKVTSVAQNSLAPTGSTRYQSAGSSRSSSAASPVSSNSTSSPPLSSRSPISPNLLDYFPEINQDGLGLSWFNEANSRSKLSAALASGKMLVCGHISLAEMSRFPVPIMAKPPLAVSDITLDSWLSEVVASKPQRGVKLSFTSTRTVEPAFRVLARHADQLLGPLILSADILAWPSGANGCARRPSKQQQQQPQQPVDAWTFLMLCQTRFPRCIISIGWCSSGISADSLRPIGWQTDGALADRASSSADSMFELDILASQPAALAQLSQLGHLGQLSQLQQQQHHHHHRLHQQLQAYSLLGAHQRAHLFGQQGGQLGQQQQQQQQQSQQQGTSSAGSVNSSSGNSSASPSPTSPVSQLMSPAQQLLGKQASDAAAMAAALVAANNFQQLPLNLNINEADGQLSQLVVQKLQQQHQQQQLHQLSLGQCELHVSKKCAIASAHNSDSPAPSARAHQLASQLLLKNAGGTQRNSTCAGYTREMIDKMASLVKEYNLSQPITFPVEAKLVRGSIGELQRLLYQVGPNSTLTVVAKPEDLISLDDLLAIRKSFACNQILFDLPDELASELRQELEMLQVST